MITADIAVCMASIPTRAAERRRALTSIATQTVLPVTVHVEVDHGREGAAATKNRALLGIESPYVTFLDDDDEMLPHHIEILHRAAMETGADVIYTWPEMVGNGDPRPDRFGVPFDADELRRGSYIPTVSLIRTELLKRVGGFQCPPGSIYDDWGAYLALLDAGAVFLHVPLRTWRWHIHAGNTSGQPVW